MPDEAFTADAPPAPAEALERGILGVATTCPFALAPDDLAYLRTVEPASPGNDDISYEPVGETLAGAPDDAEGRLADILARFSATATDWLKVAYPGYAAASLDRVTLRTREEATRRLPLTARTDLLHIDRALAWPTQGRRVLRLAVNIDPADPRVWATAEPFPVLLARFAAVHPVPVRRPDEWLASPQGLIRLFTGDRGGRTAYDAFMLRLDHFLKQDNDFQTRAARRLWQFPPGAFWLLFSDGLSHAQLRGRFALELAFFVPPAALAASDAAPLAILQAFSDTRGLRRAG